MSIECFDVKAERWNCRAIACKYCVGFTPLNCENHFLFHIVGTDCQSVRAPRQHICTTKGIYRVFLLLKHRIPITDAIALLELSSTMG